MKTKNEILQEYIDYRKNNDIKDEVIDNIFLNEMVWPDGDGKKCHLFKDFESINKFFNNIVLTKKCADNVPRSWGGKGSVCGTMLLNAIIVDDIKEVLLNRIYEELEKRR